ncbi:hypothetical protein TNCV_3751611 [Trichonephila clavipes]|nr:hypothetical protein TNCV_3751611 [Trichonephila clavipes]
MPLIYLQLVTYAKAESIYLFTEIFGTKLSLEGYDDSRNKTLKYVGDSKVSYIHWKFVIFPIKCLKCAGAYDAKNYNRAFVYPLICANSGRDHAANWRRCFRFPK